MATKKPAAAPKEAAASKEPAAPEAPPAAPKKKGKGKLIAIVAAVGLLASGGAAAWYFLAGAEEATEEVAQGDKKGDPKKAAEAKKNADKKAADKKAAAKKAPVFVPLEPFTVNLRDDDSSHYLQVAIVLEATDSSAVDNIKVQMPIIRNGILLLLSSKRSDDLGTLDGKQKLAQEIVAEARKPLTGAGVAPGIEGVYFSSFVIQ
jgi:flagellar protein FliL